MLKIHKQISQVFYSQANDGVWLEYGVIAIFDHFLWCPGGGGRGLKKRGTVREEGGAAKLANTF